MSYSLQVAIHDATHHYTKFCEALGIDITKTDTKDTPRRVARLFATELTAAQQPMPFTFTTFPCTSKDLVSVCGIRFVSTCRHHHMPVIGYAHFAYLPNKLIAGLSKIPRYIKWAAKYPSIQEEMTHDIIGGLNKLLDPSFSALTITAQHQCLACRGVMDHEARMTTTAIHAKKPKTRDYYRHTFEEFLRSVDLWYKHREIR